MNKQTIDLVLEGEFSGELASGEAVAERANYVVRRIGTSASSANINRMIGECENTAGIWEWGDNRYTVVDIRPKHPAAVALGTLGGQSTSEAKVAAARRNGRKGGRPKHSPE